jgi:hypothetical protein
VDSAGRKLLSQLYGWGTRLAGNGLCITPLIEEIVNAESQKNLRQGDV